MINIGIATRPRLLETPRKNKFRRVYLLIHTQVILHGVSRSLLDHLFHELIGKGRIMQHVAFWKKGKIKTDEEKCHRQKLFKYLKSPFRILHGRIWFYCRDLGSRNGTWLNGKRLSASKESSQDIPIGTLDQDVYSLTHVNTWQIMVPVTFEITKCQNCSIRK